MNAELIVEIVSGVVAGAAFVAGLIWAASQLVGRLKRNEKDLTGIANQGRAEAKLAAERALAEQEAAWRRHYVSSITQMALCEDVDRQWLAEMLISEEIQN